MRDTLHSNTMTTTSVATPATCTCCSRRRLYKRKWLVLFGVLLLQTVQTSAMTLLRHKTPGVVLSNTGDPAPGRSPGPPHTWDLEKREQEFRFEGIQRVGVDAGDEMKVQKVKDETNVAMPDGYKGNVRIEEQLGGIQLKYLRARRDVNEDIQGSKRTQISDIKSQSSEEDEEDFNRSALKSERFAVSDESQSGEESERKDSYLVGEFVRNLMKTRSERDDRSDEIEEENPDRNKYLVQSKRSDQRQGISDDVHNNQGDHPTIILTAQKESNTTWCQQVLDALEPDVESPDDKMAEMMNISVFHPLFKPEMGLVVGITYDVTLSKLLPNNALEYSLASLVDNVPRGVFTSQWDDATCPDSDSSLAGRLDSNAMSSRLTWSIPTHSSDRQQFNVTFRLRYRLTTDDTVLEISLQIPLLKDCRLWLWPSSANVSWHHLPPHTPDCRLSFSVTSPAALHPRGLVVEMTRLNVPCLVGGYLRFGDDHTLCGKLEELPSSDRRLYFPSIDSSKTTLSLHRSPVFTFSYHLVDYCYNVTLTKRNGTLTLKTTSNGLHCTFKIHLPYGNRVSLKLVFNSGRSLKESDAENTNFLPDENYRIPNSKSLPIIDYDDSSLEDSKPPSEPFNQLFPGPTSKSPPKNEEYEEETNVDYPKFAPFIAEPISDEYSDGPIKNNGYNDVISDVRTLKPSTLPKQVDCSTFQIRIFDGSDHYVYCNGHGEWDHKDIHVLSKENSIVFQVLVDSLYTSDDVVTLNYDAVRLTDVVRECDYGWVAVRQYCVTVVDDVRLTWQEAETECERLGGHLASVRSELAQATVDKLLINSAGYRDANSYWIGATDRMHEGDFRWTDGQTFSFTNWFPGWPDHGHYNRQPNDDGFSEQDCMEIRRGYPNAGGYQTSPSAGTRLTTSFMWNDRDCETSNYFLCEKLRVGEPLEDGWSSECNRSIVLSREQPRVSVVSPGFPRQYPDNAECQTVIVAPPDHRLVLDFEELVLETEPNCSYDHIEIFEDLQPRTSTNQSVASRKLCGDWSTKLKLLRYVSTGPRLRMRFVSDYSHHYGGFKAKVSMENAVAVDCADERLQMFNRSCYLFVSYPEVTWQTARQICKGLKAELASIRNSQEENFVTSKIRESAEYSTSAIYWLGGHQTRDKWAWLDDSQITYSAWSHNASDSSGDCLAIQWISSHGDVRPSGLYWTTHECDAVGGYVCKRENQESGSVLSLNRTINASEGFLTSPHFPHNYNNDLDYYVHLNGPSDSRVVVTFTQLDVENQLECLYDYVELQTSQGSSDMVRWCGNHGNQSSKLNFVSTNNRAVLHFHSDYSLSGAGYSANWQAVDVSGCPLQTLTARQGTLTSPHYPQFLLSRLDCATSIKALAGRRIWLEFQDYDLTSPTSEAAVEVDLGGQGRPFKPFQQQGHLNEGVFVSVAERMLVHLRTGDKPAGHGFNVKYKTVSQIREERIISLTNTTAGFLRHLNSPGAAPSYIDFTERLIAPLGSTIYLVFHATTLSDDDTVGCPDNAGWILVIDNYADNNGTASCLCEAAAGQNVVVESYLNTLVVKQKSRDFGVRMNATLNVRTDVNYKLKLIRGEEDVNIESCDPNPCQNGGKCVVNGSRRVCQCTTHFTGLFCALTICELEPCLFGQCQLTATNYMCKCATGYMGAACDQKQKPCSNNPCEGRGACHASGDTYTCSCYAWWEGPKCERRMLQIPFKPLSERMLKEPFWLGLITVTVVLGVIGIFWCAKRHFPEKLEKLLAEEADRNRPGGPSHSRPASVRDQLGSVGGAPVVVIPSPTPASGCPRTLLGRLGIRKPSLLSLTSPHGTQGHSSTARTFSLDDLLKPPPRRTPSPRKKRNNSTPTKKTIADKKQILQQLITPSANQRARKMSLVELMQLSERKPTEMSTKETSFSENSSDSKPIMDAKLEKKVHFARLLNKVSSEMSSGSEVEARAQRSTSTPPSPAGLTRSPHSTSSNQGSDSMSSLDVTGVHDLLSQRRNHNRLVPAKNTSADSILAMFRNFQSTSASNHMLSPSTTPTASSPQDELPSPTSSTSSVPTPLSSSSYTIDSPPLHRHSHTIEVPVLDMYSGHKSSSGGMNPPTILLEIPSGGQNKCLSPIREMPTPLPSPCPSRSRSPMMMRVDSEQTEEETKREREEALRGKKEMFKLKLQNAVDDNDGPCSRVPVIPVLIVEQPSPIRSPTRYCPGSPPPQRSHPGSPPHLTGFLARQADVNKAPRRLLKELDKPTSLDLPCPPPMITVTCLLSETESDTESISPTKGTMSHLMVPSNPGMCYLSPFSVCSRADRTTSESNLSSSGYSSMTSPGPSRCGSNNPLCPSESEDHQPTHRRASPLLGTRQVQSVDQPVPRGRSDSETMSDDPYIESNDEGFGTDHLDDKIEDGELKSAKELEVFVGKDFLDNGRTILGLPTLTAKTDDCQLYEDRTNWLTEMHGDKLAPSEPLCQNFFPVQVSVDGMDWGQGQGHTTPSTKTFFDAEGNDVNSDVTNRIGKFSSKERWLSNDQDYWNRVVEKLSVPNSIKKSASLEVGSDKISPKGIKKFRSFEGCQGQEKIPANVDMNRNDTREDGGSKMSLQLPSIVVEAGTTGRDNRMSPMSSRSESPLSDRGRCSPLMYNKMALTDSEYPSSDGPKPHRKSMRRRERKSRVGAITSPSSSITRLSSRVGDKSVTNVPLGHLLDVPGKDYQPPQRKPSPKRRARTVPLVSSSSSSESINSAREMRAAEKKILRSKDASGEETGEEITGQILQKVVVKDEPPKAHRKFSRLRTIGHQIRFLRRIEQSLKRRGRLVSPGDSCEEEDNDLPILKSSSINELTSGRELLIPRGDRAWRKVTITGNPSGHTD